MAAYLFWEFVILIAGVWMMAALFFIYGWILLKRQKQIMAQIFPSLKQTKSKAENPEAAPQPNPTPRHLEISRDEPMSKYQDVSPDEVDVSFVDKSE